MKAPRQLPRLPALPGSSATYRERRAFTLLELMIVVSIVAIALGLLVPAIAPATGRTVEGATRQFTADLENARQLAIAERTKTRVLIPDVNNATFGSELALRSYTIVSFNKAAGTWKQRGKWTRLPQPATFEPNPYVDAVTEDNVIGDRKTSDTAIDNSTSGSAATKTFKGAYLEYRANGSSSLDPSSKLQIIEIADGSPDGNGGMRRKNVSLQYRITIDPLTGSARVK